MDLISGVLKHGGVNPQTQMEGQLFVGKISAIRNGGFSSHV